METNAEPAGSLGGDPLGEFLGAATGEPIGIGTQQPGFQNKATKPSGQILSAGFYDHAHFMP